jgi:hypothetical protein
MPVLTLSVSAEVLAVARLAADAPIPVWASSAKGLMSITRTAQELSIICDEQVVPAGTRIESGWRALKVQGPLDFGLTGILASLTIPLAIAEVSIFALSTFDTDYVLVKQDMLPIALTALRQVGHIITAG